MVRVLNPHFLIFKVMGFFDGILSGLGLSGDSAGEGAGGGLFGGIMSMFNAGLDSLGLSQHGRDQYFNRSMQREFLERQIEAQSQENQLNRDFSKEMLDLNWQKTLQNYPDLLKMASDNQFNLWRNQFNVQNEYNSPVNQVSRMMAAGINPSANGAPLSQGVNTMGASTTTPPPNIQGSPLGGSISPMGLPQGLSANGSVLSSIGSFVKDLAAARQLGKESTRYDEVTDAMIDKMWAETQNQYALACYNGVKTVIERALGKEAKQSDILVNLRKAMVYGAQEKTEEALKWVYQAEAWLNNSKNEALQEQLPYISLQIQSLIHFLKTGSQKNLSEVSLNYAKRDLTLEQKETQKFITDTNYWTSKMNELEYVFKNDTQVERLHQYIEWSRSQGLIADQLAIDVEKAIETKDYAELKELMTVIGMGVDAFTKVGHVENGQDFNANYAARNAIEDAYVTHKMDHYADTEETYTETGVNSRGHKVTRSFNRRRAPQ